MKRQTLPCLAAIVALLAAWPLTAAESIPEWLPPEYRFAVEGTPEELAAVSTTLARVRDALPDATRQACENRKVTGAMLQWLVRFHLAQQLFNSQTPKPNQQPKPLVDCFLSPKVHPKVFSAADFPADALTAIAAKMNGTPTFPVLKPVFGKGYDTEGYRVKSIPKKVPGKDYPSLLPEIVQPDSTHCEITMRAPGPRRWFRFKADDRRGERKLQYRWVILDNFRHYMIQSWSNVNTRVPKDGFADVVLNWESAFAKSPVRIAVFSRRSERELWGPPAFITVTVPDSEKRRYSNRNRSWSIDYGEFRDDYELDEKNVIYSIQRFPKGAVLGTEIFGKPSLEFK